MSGSTLPYPYSMEEMVQRSVHSYYEGVHQGLMTCTDLMNNLSDSFWSLLNAGQIDQIIKVYEEKKQNGDDILTSDYYAIARAYVLSNNHDEAIEIYEKIIDRQKNSESDTPRHEKMSPYKNLAFAYFHRGDYQESIENCNRVIDESNNEEVVEQWQREGHTKMDVIRKALWIKGYCLKLLNRHDEAIETFMELDDPARFKFLVYMYKELGKDNTIIAEYKRFIDVDIEIQEYNSPTYFQGLRVVYDAIDRISEPEYDQYKDDIIEKVLGMDKVSGIINNIERLNFVTNIVRDKQIVKKMIKDGWRNYREDIKTLWTLQNYIIQREYRDDGNESTILQDIISFIHFYLTPEEVQDMIKSSHADFIDHKYSSSLSSASSSAVIDDIIVPDRQGGTISADLTMDPSSSDVPGGNNLAKEWNEWFHAHINDIYEHISKRCNCISMILTALGKPIITIEFNGDNPNFSQKQVDEMRTESIPTLFGTLFDSSPTPCPQIIFKVGHAKDWDSLVLFADSEDSEESTPKPADPLGSFEGFDGNESVYVFVFSAEPDGEIDIPETERGLPTVVWSPSTEPSAQRVVESTFRDENHKKMWLEFIQSSFNALADSIAKCFMNVFAVTHRLGAPCIEIWLYGMEYMHPQNGPNAIIALVQKEALRAGMECDVDIRNERPFEKYWKREIPHLPLLDRIHCPFWGITREKNGKYIQEGLFFPHIGSPVGIFELAKEAPRVSTLGCFLTAEGDVCPSFTKTPEATYALSSFHGVDATRCGIYTVMVDRIVKNNVRVNHEIGEVIKQEFTPKTKETFDRLDPLEREAERQVVTVDATLFDFSYVSRDELAPDCSLVDILDSLPDQLFHVDDGNPMFEKSIPVLKLGCTSGLTQGQIDSSGFVYERDLKFPEIIHHCTCIFAVDANNKSRPSSLPDTSGEASNRALDAFAKRGDSGAAVFGTDGRLYGFVLGGSMEEGTAYASFASETLNWARQAIRERNGPSSSGCASFSSSSSSSTVLLTEP